MNEKAKNPSPNASAQAPGSAPAKRALNEMIRQDATAGSPSMVVPESISKYYVQDGNAYKSIQIPGKIEFVDRGNRMHEYNPVTDFTTRSMMQIAEARGWKEIEVTGGDKFKQKAYIEAASRGIAVKGYEPTAKDKAVLDTRALRKEAEANPLVRTYLDANTTRARSAAIKAHPELKEAFNETRKAEVLAEAIDSKKAAKSFVGRFKDGVALAIHQGKEIPKIQGVTASANKAQETTPKKQDQDQSRSR